MLMRLLYFFMLNITCSLFKYLIVLFSYYLFTLIGLNFNILLTILILVFLSYIGSLDLAPSNNFLVVFSA